ncbi:hypothetical protein AUC70_11685 [Methyloceanibacter stevinii]|uniref:DUF6950 domain-containing protein n=1 Tax=Methyloceanibacter stevinii TaxID=1774970 RepID=A0A1E3VJ18_9HYPH|nr:hypothetical protein [Methyloceanibacter stevinii]ODR93520.1 hypothetical protein AUC70_11685 [Methyloceanibacter stevinii]
MTTRRRIFELFAKERQTPFEWGVSDCLTWCAGVAEALTGQDPVSHLRGRYSTARGAQRVMVRSGWKDMADVAASVATEIAPSAACDGDWGWFRNADGTDGLGVICGAMLVARGEQGLAQLSRMKVERAFRVE